MRNLSFHGFGFLNLINVPSFIILAKLYRLCVPTSLLELINKMMLL